MDLRSAPTRLFGKAYKRHQQWLRAQAWIAAYEEADRTGQEVVTPWIVRRKAEQRAEERTVRNVLRGP